MAAAATLLGPDALRMEEKKLEYFSSISSMARKIMQERQKIREEHGSAWDRMTAAEQDSAIDNCMMDPHIRARYAVHRVDREELVCYPKLLQQTGQKIVHFGDEDITWQDEHSAPFSWETKSQLDFSLTSGPADQAVSFSQAESKSAKLPQTSQLSKPPPGTQTSQLSKPPPGTQTSQLSKPTPATKASSGEGLGRRAEEESSFWKLSAERSRLEGEQADFLSLTPSQIKSMEKGEKPLPSYLRQETSVTTTPKEPEVSDAPHPPPHSRNTKHRAPKPPPPPVPIAVTTTPISITPSPAPVSVPAPASGWERGQSTLPSVSNTVDDVFSSSTLTSKSPALARPSGGGRERNKREGEGSPALATSPTFAQFNTSSNILKTGFDFLDNW